MLKTLLTLCVVSKLWIRASESPVITLNCNLKKKQTGMRPFRGLSVHTKVSVQKSDWLQLKTLSWDLMSFTVWRNLLEIKCFWWTTLLYRRLLFVNTTQNNNNNKRTTMTNWCFLNSHHFACGVKQYNNLIYIYSKLFSQSLLDWASAALYRWLDDELSYGPYVDCVDKCNIFFFYNCVVFLVYLFGHQTWEHILLQTVPHFC